MRMTESRLRRTIRQVIRESYELPTDPMMMSRKPQEGDQVWVLHVERPYSGTRQDWGGCEGIVHSIDRKRGVCTIIDLSGQLSPLVDCPMTDEHLKVVSSDSSGIDNVRDHISDTVNQDMPMESVLRRVIRKELKRR